MGVLVHTEPNKAAIPFYNPIYTSLNRLYKKGPLSPNAFISHYCRLLTLCLLFPVVFAFSLCPHFADNSDRLSLLITIIDAAIIVIVNAMITPTCVTVIINNIMV